MRTPRFDIPSTTIPGREGLRSSGPSRRGGLLAVALLLAAAPEVGAAPRAEDHQDCPAPEARAFDFWIGEWDVLNRGLQPDGTWAVTGRSSARIVPVLSGCAIVEHWRGTAWGRKTVGFSVRTWDPSRQAWVLVLNWPGDGRPGFGELEGTFRHGRGELFFEGRDPEGSPQQNRYTFSDIGPDSLRWDAARSTDGASWLTFWIMEFTRRSREAPALYHGPWIVDGRERGCPGDEIAAMDFLAGSWRGTETVHEPAGQAPRSVRLEVYPILEGCALMDREWSGEDEERFAVRSWDAPREQWVEYALRSGPHGFVRAAGQVSGARAELLVGAAEEGVEPGRRIVYERTDGGVVRREERWRQSGWEPVRTLELEPTFYGDQER